MKTAIIFYSCQGNSVLAAGAIQKAVNADVFEIKIADTKKRSGFALMAWGCFQVFINKKPEILPLTVDVKTYDLIILGTPVWAGSPAPAMVSFLSSVKLSGKKIALFCCHAGGKGKVFEKFRALLPECTVVGEIGFKNAAGKDSAVLEKKAAEWVKTLQ